MYIRIIIIKPKNSVNARASHGLKLISKIVLLYDKLENMGRKCKKKNVKYENISQ
jgi:hypothetical protein